jgi:hypothetical protein
MPIAQALSARLPDEGRLSIDIILDADPEVYRLGYGTLDALELLREAADQNLLGLRVQPGVRIGLIISDDTTMVYSPVPLLIEAGSTSVEKPNAIVFTGGATDQLVTAAGAGPADAVQEIGSRALTPLLATRVKENLHANPPQPFDIARAMRVFSSQVQFVEFKMQNYRVNSRQIPLPPELLGVSDDSLRKRLTSRIRALGDRSESPSVTVMINAKEKQVDEKWIENERKRIEDEFTFSVPHFGRVIFQADRKKFDAEIAAFKVVLAQYHEQIAAVVEQSREDFEKRLVNEFLPRWCKQPPPRFGKHGVEPSPENLEAELRDKVGQIWRDAVIFEPPQVRVIYKNVAPESARDPKFLDTLRDLMRRRDVPIQVIASLFASGDVAPTKGGLGTHD